MRTQTGSHPTYALILWFERFFIYLYFKNQDLIIKVLQGITKVQCCLVTEENKTNNKNNPSQVTADELYILISTCHTNHKWWMSDLGLGLTVTLYILKIHQTYWAVTEWRAVRYQGSRQKAKGCQQTMLCVAPPNTRHVLTTTESCSKWFDGQIEKHGAQWATLVGSMV